MQQEQPTWMTKSWQRVRGSFIAASTTIASAAAGLGAASAANEINGNQTPADIDTYAVVGTPLNTTAWHIGNWAGKRFGRGIPYREGSKQHKAALARAGHSIDKASAGLTATTMLSPAVSIPVGLAATPDEPAVFAWTFGPIANGAAGYVHGRRTARTQATIAQRQVGGTTNSIQ